MTAVDLGKVPKYNLSAGTLLYRIHAADRDVRYFSNRDTNRFDPCEVPARGSWYLSTDPLGCFREKFPTEAISRDEIKAAKLASIFTPRDLVLADLISPRAAAAGIDSSYALGGKPGDYERCQQLASDLQENFDGVRWHLRNDGSHALVGVAIFGKVGQPPDEEWPDCVSEPIPLSLIRKAQSVFGSFVLPDPDF